MKLFIVTYADYEDHWIVRVFSDEPLAEVYAKQLNKANEYHTGSYSVEEHDINNSLDD